MKISIEGRIIDTKNIYQIDHIVGDDCWTYMKSYAPDHILTHSGYEFTIKFFNKKYLTIYRDGNDTFKEDMWYFRFKGLKDLPEYEIALKKIYNELDLIRNTVIGYWNEDKTGIPEIKFEK